MFADSFYFNLFTDPTRMKLSQTLQALHKGPLIKRLWKNRGTCKIPEFVVPAVLRDKS